VRKGQLVMVYILTTLNVKCRVESYNNNRKNHGLCIKHGAQIYIRQKTEKTRLKEGFRSQHDG
jgi:hypothetical protein